MPVETSYKRQERRKEKGGVMAPERIQTMRPRNRTDLWGIVGYAIQTVPHNE